MEVPVLLLFVSCPMFRIKYSQDSQTNLLSRVIYVENIASDPPMTSCCIQNKIQDSLGLIDAHSFGCP